MHPRFITFLILLIVAPYAGTAGELPILAAGDLPGGKVVKTDTYSGKALFGYIDGGVKSHHLRS